jgi:hypothetical protein
MEKQLAYFDVLANAQKQVLTNLLEMQTEVRTQWFDAVDKSYTAFTNIPGVKENAATKEALTQFNNWYGTVAIATKNATSEVLKTQNNLISAYDKQVTYNRDALKSVIEVVNPILAKVKLA